MSVSRIIFALAKMLCKRRTMPYFLKNNRIVFIHFYHWIFIISIGSLWLNFDHWDLSASSFFSISQHTIVVYYLFQLVFNPESEKSFFDFHAHTQSPVSEDRSPIKTTTRSLRRNCGLLSFSSSFDHSNNFLHDDN